MSWKKFAWPALLLLAVLSVLLGVGVGSVFVPPTDVLASLGVRFFGMTAPDGLDEITVSMVTNMRLPRVLMAFLAGAALSMGGTVMQSVLRNPLASPFGLGISAGAGTGAALVMVLGLSGGALGIFFMPLVSLVFGLLTVVAVIGFSARMDRDLSSTTIVLTGMVVSLFLNAIMSFLSTLSPAYAQRINLWTLGSFSMKEWSQVLVLAPITVICCLFFMRFSAELDAMTFGEEQAQLLGVDVRRAKWLLIGLVAVLVGTTTAFVGIIGFVDLIAPHVVRRFFGSSHRRVLPASALFGGCFMVLCDLASRTLTAPREIPIGSITAFVGTPFFIYIYFVGRRRR